jgi:hypothetical protein
VRQRDDRSDEDLMTAYRAGERAAFDDLFFRFVEPVTRDRVRSGDKGYVGGRWMVPNDQGGFDHFLCPLLGPGRTTP